MHRKLLNNYMISYQLLYVIFLTTVLDNVGLFKFRETINLTEGLKYNLLCNIKIAERTKHEAVSDSWHNLIANDKTSGRLNKAQQTAELLVP